jgi:hypothetical protein
VASPAAAAAAMNSRVWEDGGCGSGGSSTSSLLKSHKNQVEWDGADDAAATHAVHDESVAESGKRLIQL